MQGRHVVICRRQEYMLAQLEPNIFRQSSSEHFEPVQAGIEKFDNHHSVPQSSQHEFHTAQDVEMCSCASSGLLVTSGGALGPNPSLESLRSLPKACQRDPEILPERQIQIGIARARVAHAHGFLILVVARLRNGIPALP